MRYLLVCITFLFFLWLTSGNSIWPSGFWDLTEWFENPGIWPSGWYLTEWLVFDRVVLKCLFLERIPRPNPNPNPDLTQIHLCPWIKWGQRPEVVSRDDVITKAVEIISSVTYRNHSVKYRNHSVKYLNFWTTRSNTGIFEPLGQIPKTTLSNTTSRLTSHPKRNR